MLEGDNKSSSYRLSATAWVLRGLAVVNFKARRGRISFLPFFLAGSTSSVKRRIESETPRISRHYSQPSRRRHRSKGRDEVSERRPVRASPRDRHLRLQLVATTRYHSVTAASRGHENLGAHSRGRDLSLSLSVHFFRTECPRQHASDKDQTRAMTPRMPPPSTSPALTTT